MLAMEPTFGEMGQKQISEDTHEYPFVLHPVLPALQRGPASQ